MNMQKRNILCSRFAGMLWCLLMLLPQLATAQKKQYSNLPTLYIDTYGGRSVSSKSTYVLSTLTWVHGGETVVYDSVEIRGRGNSTWGLAKKPYRLRFKESTKFLGKGHAKARSWVLLANHADKSLIRNAVTFDMGSTIGQPFAPSTEFVDLVLNGTFLGNYHVTDQVNIDSKRVNIVEQEEKATAESDISGGYLVEIDGFGSSEPVNFRTSKNLIISVKSPDETIINNAQKTYIKDFMNNFESVLFGSSWQDPDRGYRAIADSATLVTWYIASELSANPDCFWSTFVYKDQYDPHLYFGPLWDYDIAYNNCNRVGDVTNRLMTDAGFGSDLTKVWVNRMVKDAWFNQAVNDAWLTMLDNGLEQHMLAYVDSLATLLDRSQALNYNRYSISSRVYNEITLYSTYSAYINQLKTFISSHIAYLTKAFAQRAQNTGGGGGQVTPSTLKPFEPDDSYYWRISNKGTNSSVDVSSATEGAGVVMWSPTYGRETQQWLIKAVGKNYAIVNRVGNLALNDPSPSSATGTQLNVVAFNEKDQRQLWRLETVNENGLYNIINVGTGHAINNSGGGSSNGNSIISYTSDDRNSVSNNRQWLVEKDEMVPDYVSDEVRKALADAVADAEKFLASLSASAVGTHAGQYPADEVEKLRAMAADAKDFDSTVEDDFILCMVQLQEQLKMASTPNPKSKEQQKLETLLQKAQQFLATADDSWAGSEPFQLSESTYEDLVDMVEYLTANDLNLMDDCDLYVSALDELLGDIALLNAPDPDKEYLLLHLSGLYFDAKDGIRLVDSGEEESITPVRFVPSDNAANAYYIMVGDCWLSVLPGTGGQLALSETRNTAFGRFTAQQDGDCTFRLLSYYGMLGAPDEPEHGDPCLGTVSDDGMVTWMLEEAAPSAVAPVTVTLDYEVCYDPDRRVVSFRSADTDALATVSAELYTTGGRLLYTFRGDEEQELGALPSGTYLLRWSANGEAHTVKLLLKGAAN